LPTKFRKSSTTFTPSALKIIYPLDSWLRLCGIVCSITGDRDIQDFVREQRRKALN
jgi:hypothetical protein